MNFDNSFDSNASYDENEDLLQAFFSNHNCDDGKLDVLEVLAAFFQQQRWSPKKDGVCIPRDVYYTPERTIWG